jgi:O-antigen/teichoic acid export membrane protein
MTKPADATTDDTTNIAAEERAVAVRGAFVLGASLIATWTVGLLVRVFLPRFLGPSAFGAYGFAESFPLAFFAFLGLGVETYIQKEIPLRPAHVSDFFGGVLVVRALMTLALFVIMAAVLAIGGRSMQVQQLVLVFGVAQFFASLNTMLAAALQASQKVGGLAIVNVASKVVWGLGCIVALALHAPLISIAFAFLASEAAKSAALFWLVRKLMSLRLRVDLAAAKRVVIACLPYYVNAVAVTIYARVDVTIVSFLTNDDETGWYASAQNLAGITMLLAPLMGSVLTPLMSRVASRSREELDETLRRTMETVTALTIPVTLMMGLGADFAVRYGLGARFLQATPQVAILAPMFVLTYLAIILSTYLMLTDRPWVVTIVSLIALVLDSLSNIVFAPRAFAMFGPGGAGIGCAISLIATEILVVATFIKIVGPARCFDRRSLVTIGKSVAVAAGVGLADHFLRALGYSRLILDGVLYLVVAHVTGAFDIRAMFRAVRAGRRGAAA